MIVCMHVLAKQTGATKIQATEKFKRRLFLRTKNNLQIFEVTPFIKLQNHT